MKKAVIQTGSKQYLVSEGDVLEVEKLTDTKSTSFGVLAIIDDDKTVIGRPQIEKAEVRAEVLKSEVLADKVTSIRFKAKKRIKKIRGHRQRLTQIKITKINS